MSTNSCVSGYNASSLQVRVGTDKLGHRGQLFQVIGISPYVNSGMNPAPGPTPSFAADVALIKTAVSFTYDPRVMWLNPNNDGIHGLQGGVIASWGNPKILGSPLISASVTVLPPAGCAYIYNGIRNISSTEFCVWPADTSSQPCLADLGAPFYYNEQYYGLVTYNPGCSNTAFPVIVTEVSQFTSFIITILCDMASFFP
ncbi:hypodermin-A-like [Homalodisca vitripennis]|uniref:hypodermin-A-like n=1 Tax=Homalodisca vitripennis TaxID=197043 RepID=UPI001EEA8422|nr:hypodermin-A-like [Homalodisca vitripennis]